LAASLCLTLGLGFAGCSGGESSPSTPCLPASFTPAIATVAPGDVFLGEQASTCNSVVVSVLINNLTGIFTVGFDVTFPAGVLSYDSYTAGPLLKKGPPATNPVFLVTNSAPGVIQVTATRFGGDPSVAAVGTETLMTLTFSKITSGTGSIDFDDSGASLVDEVVLDETGTSRPASFQPDHGGIFIVP
jgi:hypothetical protein